jgi:hypothetical protein
MSKRNRRDSGEDLWAWAERRDAAPSARLQETPHEEPEVSSTGTRQPGSFAKVLSVLGLKSGSGVSLTR